MDPKMSYEFSPIEIFDSICFHTFEWFTPNMVPICHKDNAFKYALYRKRDKQIKLGISALKILKLIMKVQLVIKVQLNFKIFKKCNKKGPNTQKKLQILGFISIIS